MGVFVGSQSHGYIRQEAAELLGLSECYCGLVKLQFGLNLRRFWEGTVPTFNRILQLLEFISNTTYRSGS